MRGDQAIYCTVFDCAHCDTTNELCYLDGIEIVNCHGNGNQENTMCSSYDKRRG
jgi:hypothetical protein